MATLANATYQNSPPYRLFDSADVFLAALFGGPIAGALLMALNYRRIGNARYAAIALLIGIPVGAVILLAAWKIPSSASSSIAFIALLGITSAARKLQGAAVRDHLQLGGKLVSRWESFGLGFAFFALLFGSVYESASWQEEHSKITIGSRDSIYFSGSATREQAVALGNMLKTSGYFSDRGVDVLIARDKDGVVLSFITKEGAWQDPEMVSSFDELGREAAPILGGFPLRVRMLDKDKNIHKESLVGKVALAGDDSVYYLGDATQAQAQSLASALQADNYLQGHGADVFLTESNHALTLSFVVGDSAAEQPGTLQRYEGIVRRVSPSLGRMPIQLRLISPTLAVEKQESVS